MSDFLTFRRMVTPLIVQIVFWIATAAAVVASITVMVSGLTVERGGGGQVFGGILLLVLGPLAVRIYCEILIVLFRINETLTDIKEGLARRSD